MLGSNNAVPYLGRRIEEGFLNIVKSGMWHFQMMIRSHSYLLRGSGVVMRICWWEQVSLENQLITEDLVGSSCPSFLSSLVQTVPVEVLQYLRNGEFVIVTFLWIFICGELGSIVLDHLQPLVVLLRCWLPTGGGVFEYWPDTCLVRLGFNRLWREMEVPSQHIEDCRGTFSFFLHMSSK